MRFGAEVRVAVLVDSAQWGGLETHAVGLIDELQRLGHQPLLLCSTAAGEAMFRGMSPGGAPITTFDSNRPLGARTRHEWVSIRDRFDIDTLVFEKGTLHAGGLWMDARLRTVFRRYVAVLHLAPPVVPPPSRRRFLGILPSPNLWRRRFVARGRVRAIFPHLTVSVSEAVRQLLISQYHFPAARVVTVHNGVDLDRFRADSASRQQARTSWGIPEAAIVFGMVCRLVRDKSVDEAIDAFATLTRTKGYDQSWLVIVGEGPERSALERRATSRGVDGGVRFTGFVSDTPQVYRGIDYYVQVSHMEAMPMTLLEALASGCLVIATSVGGTVEIVTEPQLGWLVPPGDPPALLEALRTAADLPPVLRMAMSERARESVSARFSSGRQYRSLIDLVMGSQA